MNKEMHEMWLQQDLQSARRIVAAERKRANFWRAHYFTLAGGIALTGALLVWLA